MAESSPSERGDASPKHLSRYRTGRADLDALVQQLVEAAGVSPDEDLVAEMVVSALRLGREAVDRGELKLVNSALKELRYAFLVFDPYEDTRKVSIFGSARIEEHSSEYEVARTLGRRMADEGWMVITGAGPGIMEAGIEGAGAASSFGVNIVLPFESEAAPVIAGDPKLINFRYFFTRKLMFMKESHGFVLLPGGFGTMDEAFELLTLQQTGRSALAPIVLLDPPGSSYWEGFRTFVSDELLGRGLVSPTDLDLFRICQSVDDAADELTGFYTTFHSSRYVGRRLVLRLNHDIDDATLRRINVDFGDIAAGPIERIDATSSEIDDDDHPELPRLSLRFDRKGISRLRQLIDVLNGRR
jgi:hypothetical protein